MGEKLEEYTEVECVQCKQKFESKDEITEHEESGQECDLCEEWLCDGTSLAKHKKKEHEITSEEGNKEEEMETPVIEIECVQCNMTFESEEEIIEHENYGQECDQCGKWICDGISLKRHNKKEHEITRQKGNKEEDMEIDGTKIECVECNEKFKSIDKIIEHITKNECGGLTCCETYLRKHMKKEQRNTNEQDIEKEDNKEENNERKNSETRIMIGDSTNQSNRSEDYDLKNNKTETLQVSKNCGFKYPSKIKHKRIKHVDNQMNKKEAKLTNTYQKSKWDQGVGIYPLIQLKEVGIKH